MTHGLQIFSANGALQLDTTDSSHIIYQKAASGTSGAITGASAGDFQGVIVNVSGFDNTEDLIFIQPTGTSGTISAYVIPGSNGFTIFSDTNTTFYYYVFSKVTSLTNPTSNFGIQVFDTSGNIIFNQDVLAARVKGTITGSGNIAASGKSLYGMGTFKYQRIGAQLNPRRGTISAWVHKWNPARDTVTFLTSVISPNGAQANSEAELGDMFYFDSTSPTTLVIEAPDPT